MRENPDMEAPLHHNYFYNLSNKHTAVSEIFKEILMSFITKYDTSLQS
jgi:hypothetical protein